MTNWSKVKKDEKLGKTFSIDLCQADINYNKSLEAMAKIGNYNKTKDENIFNLGIKWFEEGLFLEDADENYKNHLSFINGYNVAKRRQQVSELQSSHKSR